MLGWFISVAREDIRFYAFYLAIKQRCHEGVIHNYRSIIPLLSKKIGLSESSFRRLLAQCKKNGLLFEDEAKGLRFVSSKKVLLRIKELYPNYFTSNNTDKSKKKKYRETSKIYTTSLCRYSDLVLWLKSLNIFNNCTQQLREIKKKLQLKGIKTEKKLNEKSADDFSSFQISRRKLAYILNLKSSSGASYVMKQLCQLKLFESDERRALKLRKITKLEYNINYSHNGKYFYSNGYLWENLCNLLTVSPSKYNYIAIS